MNRLRHRIVRRLHLWLALPLGLFLIVLGVTGSAITWMHEADVVLHPELLQVKAGDSTILQSPSVLLARLNATPGYASPYMLELPEQETDVLVAWYKVPEQGWARQVMLNPYTGMIMGQRNWGEPGLSRALIMPTLFHLHRQLLAGETGKIVVSINGLLLAIIALSGVYLWWPVWRLKAWWNAMTVALNGSWKRFNFSLHRAAGFYAAPVFLMLAFTGIYLNTPHWIMPIVTPFIKPAPTTPPQKKPLTGQARLVSLDEILLIAQQQFPTARMSRINFPKHSDAPYEIRLHQPGELRQRTGATRVRIDKYGMIITIQDPLQSRQWERIVSYFFPLHSGEIFGIGSKLFISLFGLMPLLFVVSGILIWLKRKHK